MARFRLPKLRLKPPRLPPILDRWARTAGARLAPLLRPVWARLAPLLSAIWAWLRRKPRPSYPILKPYVNPRTWGRRITLILFPIILFLFCLVYGFFYALTTPYLIVGFAAPVAFLVLLAIWALPDQPHAPTKLMELFFAAMLISLILWPNYLALALPGLPWITVMRLTMFPMAFFLLITLSTSQPFRSELAGALRAVSGFRTALALFVIMQFATLPFSKSISSSLQKALLQQISWTSVTLIAAWVFLKPGRVRTYVNLILLLAAPVIVITVLEAKQQKLLWTGHVPSFLKIDDPAAEAAMQGIVRSANGKYRAKATFSGPLGLGEYLALLTPFAIHIAMTGRNLIARVICGAMIPLIFLCFILADSRLGIVGFITSVLLYGLLWGVMRMRQARNSLVAAAIVYAYPAFFGATLAGVLFVGKIHNMVLGGGAQAASNAARQNQVRMAIPKFLANPIGHGPSQSGLAMGYSADSFITVDNYYITLALDYGAIGIASFLATFGLTIGYGVRAAMTPTALKDQELSYLVPLSVALSAFLVIKAVFSQQDSHSLLFAMIGMALALIYRTTAAENMAASSASMRAPPVKAPTTRSKIRPRGAPASIR
jgi:hypothetical protein